MFSLIITIISIGLVAILAIASVYYGGTAFNSGNVKGNASTLVAQAQQISAARTLYFNDHSANPTNLASLAPAYLQSVPSAPAAVTSGAWSLSGQVASIAVTSDPVCLAVNVTAGLSSTAIPTTMPAGVVYGCFGTTGANTLSYVQ